MKTIRAWWPTGPAPGNLGDTLSPLLLKSYGYNVEHAPQRDADWLFTGSIIRFARKGTNVLGTGAMRATDPICKDANYLSVRGPLTRGCVIDGGGKCPDIYGDPGLLAARFVPNFSKHCFESGIIPHYVDKEHKEVSAFKGAKIDVLTDDPVEAIDYIYSCERIYSSSLHGIIIAHALGIPAAWVKLSDKLNGHPQDLKFHDYAASVGISLIPYRTVAEAVPILPDMNRVAKMADNLDQMFRNL